MITVVTPVYNASGFLDRTIGSVLEQPEVAEYIIVDDGSTDNSLDIIKSWAQKDKRIKVLQHKDHGNHGRSVSKNLGIENATSEYIAFLDADDYYLPNRFSGDIKILEEHPEVDGVYNAIAAHYYENYDGPRPGWLNLTTMNSRVSSTELFEKMTPIGNGGWFSGDGLTVRREFFKRAGLFNPNLEVAEDTEMWIKMSLVGTLEPSNIVDPVAMRGVHDKNIFNKNKQYYQSLVCMYNSLIKFALINGASRNRIAKLWAVRSKVICARFPDRYGRWLLFKDSLRMMAINPGLIRVTDIRLQPLQSFSYLLKKTFT